MDLRTLDFAPDRQRMQIQAIAALVMSAVGKHIPDDGSSHKHAVYDLIDALDKAGIEIITADDRAKAGLPPRSFKGWTEQELHILENQRMLAMLSPMPPLIVTAEDADRIMQAQAEGTARQAGAIGLRR